MAITMAQNCNLPAPTGLTWTYPSQNTVKFTWNSVPDAWGYKIALNAQNTQGQGQIIQAPTTEATFTYVPDTTYDVELYAGNSATNFSPNKTIARFTPNGLIIVVDINPGLMRECNAIAMIWAKDLIEVNTTYISEPAIGVGGLYQIDFKHNGKRASAAFRHDLDPNLGDFISYVTNFQLLTNTEWGLTGSDIIFNNNFLKAKFKKYEESAVLKVNINYDKKIVFSTEGDGTFSDFKVYQCLPEGRSKETTPAYAASPNPFLDQINIFLKGHAQGTVTAKMLDAAGQLKWIQQYDSASLQDQAVVIQTQDMPAGMYFLQISDASGVLQTHRLIKQ
jgi:hypothetical protein